MTYYESNKERLLANQKRYYERHREERIKYQKSYQAINGINDRARSRISKWELANPEKVKIKQRIKRMRRKAREKGSRCDGSITACALQALYEKFSFCPYCGVMLVLKNRTLDHKHPLILGGPHTLENLIPCCHKCNSKKGAMPYESWLKVMPIAV